MLFFIIWMAIGIIGELAIGIYAGMESAKIEDEYGLDDNSTDRDFHSAIDRTAWEVIPLTSLTMRLKIQRSKIWIPIAILNNLCGFILWPIVLPRLYANINEVITMLREYLIK